MFQKEILSAGQPALWAPGDKAVFHFKVMRGDTLALLDDSKTSPLGPFELRLGKGFVLQVWEDMVRTMGLEEAARFVVQPQACTAYPQVAVALRDEAKRKGRHCDENHDHNAGCGAGHAQPTAADCAQDHNHADGTCAHGHSHHDAHGHGHGHDHDHEHHHGGCAAHMGHMKEYADLFELNDIPLIMELQIVKREAAGAFQKEMWEMTIEERSAAVPQHKNKGNELFKSGDYPAAIEEYLQALAHIETMSKATNKFGGPLSDEQVAEVMTYKAPCLLNMAACQLKLQQFAEAISSATSAIEADPKNPKAYFRRAQAHFQRNRDLDKALEDAEQCRKLSTESDVAVEKLLADIKVTMKQQAQADRARFKGVF